MQHYSDALAIDEQRTANAQIAQDLVGRGGAYSLLGRNDEARQDLHRAATLLSEAGRESSQWVAWLNLADSFEESDPDSAAFYYRMGLDLKLALTDSLGIPYSLNHLSGLAAQQGDIAEARRLLAQSDRYRAATGSTSGPGRSRSSF